MLGSTNIVPVTGWAAFEVVEVVGRQNSRQRGPLLRDRNATIWYEPLQSSQRIAIAHDRQFAAQLMSRTARHAILAMAEMEGWGEVHEHERGFYSEHGRITALTMRGPASLWSLARRIQDAYDIPVQFQLTEESEHKTGHRRGWERGMKRGRR
jgi:hypothetical protein